MAPAALAVLAVWHSTGQGHFGTDPLQTALFAGAGVVTALPLLAFGAAAIRIPLSSLGLLRYLTPILQFLLGVLVFGETLSAVGWLGFGLIGWRSRCSRSMRCGPPGDRVDSDHIARLESTQAAGRGMPCWGGTARCGLCYWLPWPWWQAP